MSRTIDVPRERWRTFVDSINRLIHDRPVRVEVARADIGDQELGDRLCFRGIHFESKGSEAGSIAISVSAAAPGDDDAVIHHVPLVVGVAMGVNNEGATQWIAIAAQDGGKTIVHLEQLIPLEAAYSSS